jgi:hypothetical protein
VLVQSLISNGMEKYNYRRRARGQYGSSGSEGGTLPRSYISQGKGTSSGRCRLESLEQGRPSCTDGEAVRQCLVASLYAASPW